MPLLSVDEIFTKSCPHKLFKRVTSIGRLEDNDIVIDNDSIEPTHCLLYFETEGFYIEALSRKSIVTINGKRQKKKTKIIDGDAIKLGDVTTHFSIYDDALAENKSEKNNVSLPANLKINHTSAETLAWSKLKELASYLAEPYTLNKLLDRIIDDVVELGVAHMGVDLGLVAHHRGDFLDLCGDTDGRGECGTEQLDGFPGAALHI